MFILDIIHPFLGQLLVGKTPTSPAANLHRSDKDSWTWQGGFCWRHPSSASHQRAGQRNSQVHSAFFLCVFLFPPLKLSLWHISVTLLVVVFFFFNAMHITLLYTSIYFFIIIKCLSSACLVHFYIVLRKNINVKCCWITVFVCPFSGNRLFPVLPGNGRITQDDLVVGGYFIPKGVRPMET